MPIAWFRGASEQGFLGFCALVTAPGYHGSEPLQPILVAAYTKESRGLCRSSPDNTGSPLRRPGTRAKCTHLTSGLSRHDGSTEPMGRIDGGRTGAIESGFTTKPVTFTAGIATAVLFAVSRLI
jgi:hypothetical protein